MKDLFTNKYFLILLAVTVALLFCMAVYTTERNKVSFGEDAAYHLLTPVQQLITGISDGVTGFFGYFQNVKELEREKEELEIRIAELESEIRRSDELQMENQRLRDMLAFKDAFGEYDLVAAAVIAKDPGNWFHSFTINKGTSDGLTNRSAVLTPVGVVGQIYEIGSDWAKVMSIIDTGSAVGSAVARTGDIALVEGDALLAKEGLCKMTYVTKNTNVTAGDLVETSGLGGVYPQGLLIGKVRELNPDTFGVSQYAVIEPAVSFDRITEVLVIRRGE